jgi:Uma2 family endonuclease
MPRAATRRVTTKTFDELYARLGRVPLRRIRTTPPPGTATARDVNRILDHENVICELVDGVLVEKVMAYSEGSLAAAIIGHLSIYLAEYDLGNVSGADGTLKLWPGLVRAPDVSFVSWDKLPGRQLPSQKIPLLIPDLAVEVLSESNTRGEMERKLKEYFLAGVRLVWYIDPETRTARVFTAPDEAVTLTESDSLDGGDVLPGFTLPLKKLFAKMPKSAKKPRRKKS